jgi:DnaK suppressor protein
MVATFDELRERLKEEREHLIKELEQLKASAPVIGEAKEGSPYGKKEEGAAEAFELEKRLALEKSLMESRNDVEHALDKFEQGTYGQCDSCGKLINVERLEVFPQASLCLNCKASQSKNAKVKFPPR